MRKRDGTVRLSREVGGGWALVVTVATNFGHEAAGFVFTDVDRLDEFGRLLLAWLDGLAETPGRSFPMTAQGVNSVKTAKASICAKLPRPLKAALAAEAERLQMSVNDLAGSLLGEHYSLTFPRSGRRGCRPASAAAQFVVLRLPRLLVEAIRDDAYGKRTNLTHQIVLVLAQALGVQVEVSEPRRTIPLGGGRRRIP